MPMFDVQAEIAAAEGKYPPFTFRGLDGNEYSLPHAMTLTEHQGELIAAGELKAVMGEFLDEAGLAAVDAMPIFVATKFVEAWLSQAGDEGKEQSPSSETPSGDVPSPETSQPAA